MRARRSAPLLVLLVAVLAAAPAFAADPTHVTIAGSLQSELGCANDWMPDCAAAHLTYDGDDTVWQGTFDVPAGSFEYKAALNDSWDENYGANAQSNGANIPLNLASAKAVKFYYDHGTHWVTSDANSVIATAPGSYQHFIGCPGDWQPDCLRSWLKDPDGDGIYTFRTRSIPAGNYEVKAAISESWSENYGAGGVQNGPNISFTVAADCAEIEFSYVAATHVLTVGTPAPLPLPASVTIAGSLQSELGCSGDWQPDCANTHLTYDASDLVWQGTFNVPAGGWEYKAALNDSWDVNYGANAQSNGANIPLNLASAAAVKFYYDDETHWVTDNRSSVIAVAPGSFQSELGCPGDWQPDCLRSWLKDPDGDGIYTFNAVLPAGDYETKVALRESWDENYGAGGVQNGPNIAFSVAKACATTFFSYDATTHVLTVSTAGGPAGDLGKAQAHWVTADTIAWNPAGFDAAGTFRLHFAPTGGLGLDAGGVTGGDPVPLTLTYDAGGLPADVAARFPHLASFKAFHVASTDLALVPSILRGQLAVSAVSSGGTPMDATSLQIPGVLDDLYAYEGPLGVTFAAGAPTIRVWAPTARAVTLRLFDDSAPATSFTSLPMTRDASTGVFSITGDSTWNGKFYLFDVEVFVRQTKAVEHDVVTDPYSVSLAKNSARSQIVDLDDPALKPDGWDALVKPPLEAPEDIAIYELHVRDFSAKDDTVPAEHRGTFRAFADAGSNGMLHLASLADAGLTHVHLLPSFDISSVNEDKSTWQEPAGDLSSFPPDSTEQQARVSAVRATDAYNWGYDPWHYTTPEGSYATDADGTSRILEFRQMVQGLAGAGLRVVMDVVYNHTTAAGLNDHSVLDKIVPGYYHRLNGDGNVETSSCCANTATEHDMMRKLMVDSLVTWAREYKVDGFRFDLMGHHMKRDVLAARAALDALTPAADGVDGPKIYLYGEGWNFGEVADNARGVNATQANMAGTGVGTFNDRIRDGARGGGPFSGIREQGFLTGLSYDPNGTDQGSAADQRARLLLETDWIRIGLAGNLASYTFTDRLGNVVQGSQLDYNGQRAGYTADPQEDISYIEAHDNETLFDAIQLKSSSADTIADRERAQALGIDLLAFGQGIPFFHAGVDMLRSKSMDRNSYDSGDWFNALDFTYFTNNWGVGLPPAGDNQSSWPLMAPLLADPTLKPSSADIVAATARMREALGIRKSSKLFRLRTADDVNARLKHYNTGPSQLEGLIVMSLSDAAGAVDRAHDLVAVLLNANDEEQTFTDAAFAGKALRLHPVLAASADPVSRTSAFVASTGAFTVPARTAAVFWEFRPAASRITLLAADVKALRLDGRTEKKLITKLDAALKSLQKQTAAAVNNLTGFVNLLRDLVAGGTLTEAQAQPLIDEALDIIAFLKS